MKRKAMALMLALSMCLSLLSACGLGGAATDDKSPESGDAVDSADQWPEEFEEQPEESEESGEQPEESGEPREEEPEESAEPTQEEPEEESNAGTEFLALLQEEWKNGFVEGEGPNRTYYNSRGGWREGFIQNGVIYLADVKGYGDQWYCCYDITSKEFHKASFALDVWYDNPSRYFVDNNFYFLYNTFGYAGSEYTQELRMYDYNGTLLNSYPYANSYFIFEKGFLAMTTPYNDNPDVLLSHSLEKIAEIPVPQVEIEHGLKEDVTFERNLAFAADGTVYTMAYGNETCYLYRLNTDIHEWENLGEREDFYDSFSVFCGRYISRSDGIYDCVTEEQVFEYGDLYPAVDYYNSLCYFGGDEYLGYKNSEYRWVNLKDMSMSDPLLFPEGKSAAVLDDTYCVYKDEYGWFLWNYNTGEEETIVMFDN